MDRRTIAREWLYLLALVIGGLTGVPLILAVVRRITNDGSGVTPGQQYSLLFAALVDHREWRIAWLVVLAPYLVFQLVRSVLWAFRVVNKAQN